MLAYKLYGICSVSSILFHLTYNLSIGTKPDEGILCLKTLLASFNNWSLVADLVSLASSDYQGYKTATPRLDTSNKVAG